MKSRFRRCFGASETRPTKIHRCKMRLSKLLLKNYKTNILRFSVLSTPSTMSWFSIFISNILPWWSNYWERLFLSLSIDCKWLWCLISSPTQSRNIFPIYCKRKSSSNPVWNNYWRGMPRRGKNLSIMWNISLRPISIRLSFKIIFIFCTIWTILWRFSLCSCSRFGKFNHPIWNSDPAYSKRLFICFMIATWFKFWKEIRTKHFSVIWNIISNLCIWSNWSPKWKN